MTSAPGRCLRVAVVGAGIGSQHVEAYVKLPDRYEVIAVGDLNAARAREVADRFGVPETIGCGPGTDSAITDEFDTPVDCESVQASRDFQPDVDADGLVLDYEGIWTAVARGG